MRERARKHFVGRNAELKLLANLLAASEKEPQVLVLRGEAGLGKSPLLRMFTWEAEEAGLRVVWGSGEHLPTTAEAITAQLRPLTTTHADPWTDLGTRDRPDVLVLDTAERLWPCIGWVLGEALARAGRRILVVIATRSPMPASLRALVGFSTSNAEAVMAPFSTAEVRQAMEVRGLPLASVEEVERRCAGSPLAFALLAEHFGRTGKLPAFQSREDPWLVLSQGFLRDAMTAAQANALRALSVCHVADPELLAAMLDVQDALALFAELQATRPDLAPGFVERGVNVLAHRAAASPLSTSCEVFMEAFFLARETKRARAFLFLETCGVRRYGARATKTSCGFASASNASKVPLPARRSTRWSTTAARRSSPSSTKTTPRRAYFLRSIRAMHRPTSFGPT
ncbi:MAG TPA: FAD/NAD(P)-binding oxidoreductase, partial [Labilithrix sp.]|nr:FAD/NAD(P)-binding oxidoreductase [Labilithrix sp.]